MAATSKVRGGYRLASYGRLSVLTVAGARVLLACTRWESVVVGGHAFRGAYSFWESPHLGAACSCGESESAVWCSRSARYSSVAGVWSGAAGAFACRARSESARSARRCRAARRGRGVVWPTSPRGV